MNKSLTLNFKVVDDKKKKKAKSTLVVDLLKRRGVSGTQAVRMFQQCGAEYLVRKCFHLDWYVDKYLNSNYPVKDTRRWLIACINNNHNESDEFLDWLDRKKEYIINNGNDDLKALVEI